MAALDDLESRFPKAGPGSRAATIKAYLKYLRCRLQAPQWVCVATAPAPGCSAQRRMPLSEVQQQVPEWEKIFDLALDAFEASTPGLLTQEAMLLMMRDANAAFVVLNDAMSNALEAHYECDLLAAAEHLKLWRTFPTRAHRLMDVQRGTQSLVAHAMAARSHQAGGEQAAVGTASLLLWPSAHATTQRHAAA